MPRHVLNRTRRTLFAVALSAFALSPAAAFGAPPAPTAGAAVVDGNPSEWSSADRFSDMIRAGGNGGQTTVEAVLDLRYDCANTVLYARVAAEAGVTIPTNLPDDNFIKIGGVKFVDGSSGDDGTPPDFAYVGVNGGQAAGWEASLTVPPGSYTINVHAQVEDGGLQTAAVPNRSIPLVIACGKPQPKPLTVTKTATTSYQRTFNWLVAKSAAPAKVTTDGATATTTYTVTVTKSAPVDSGFTVSGDITVANPNAASVSGVTVADAIQGGPSCAVTGGTGVTVPGYGSVTLPYTCAATSATAGINVATATWSGGASAGEAPFTFGAPSATTNATVDVVDAFNGGVPTLLAGGDDLAASAVFTYTRTVDVPKTGCMVYPNTATITSPDGLTGQASAQFEACRTPPTPPTTPTPQAPPAVVTGGGATPQAALRITKRGPKNASSGQVITFSIVVRNTSATTATAVRLTDILPAGYAIAQVPSGATLRKGRLAWTVGDLAAGTSKTVRVRVRLDRSLSGRRCNTATASAANASTVRSRACTAIVRVAGASRIPIVTG